MNSKKKQGFWMSLFAPKPCACTAEVDKLIEESQPQEQATNESEQDQPNLNNTKASECSCGGKC